MFDSLTWRRQTYERHLLGLDDDGLDDEDFDEWDDIEEEERYYQDQIDDGLCVDGPPRGRHRTRPRGGTARLEARPAEP